MSRADQYQLIVFDWDGTLMDSERKIINCFCASARDVGIPEPEDHQVRNIIGLGLKQAMEAVFSDATPEQHDALVEGYRHHFLEADQTEMPLFDGVENGLKQLAEQGRMLGVATGKARRGLKRVLESTGLGPLFVATRCADETFSKPHPQMLLEILDETGVEPHQALMVGDTTYDLEMARNAGMDSLAVCYGAHDGYRLQQEKPLACLKDFHAVYQWLT